ncbi:MAG TPA: hypothetical protein PLD20_13000 [Blastocatellia bacterium]|nr:hypothetical protein [Blastocatellia bacterium]HMV87201.1 hypothetical protein [Blastocatellia bacterium]HMX25555.1 hypothetical protein [Blastocatellia bacterium]HMY70289.1 hypothetical protein [Blastocatellia bacterium]HMZ18846.1 hypothetical protein [Blastocatellia bacterium]
MANRTVEITFRGVATEAEYEELVRAAQFRDCPACRTRFHGQAGQAGPNSRLYCSDKCRTTAEREHAPLVRPQPQTTKINGWDI